jgi:hypothetical protein
MPSVYVDVSLFTKEDAFGRISGVLELAVIPQIGDWLSFDFPKRGEQTVHSPGIVKVTDRIISANGDEQVQLSLDDITVATSDDARAVMTFLEKSYGLIGDPYKGNERPDAVR